MKFICTKVVSLAVSDPLEKLGECVTASPRLQTQPPARFGDSAVNVQQNSLGAYQPCAVVMPPVRLLSGQPCKGIWRHVGGGLQTAVFASTFVAQYRGQHPARVMPCLWCLGTLPQLNSASKQSPGAARCLYSVWCPPDRLALHAGMPTFWRPPHLASPRCNVVAFLRVVWVDTFVQDVLGHFILTVHLQSILSSVLYAVLIVFLTAVHAVDHTTLRFYSWFTPVWGYTVALCYTPEGRVFDSGLGHSIFQ
jgi:hypothetical protein